MEGAERLVLAVLLASACRICAGQLSSFFPEHLALRTVREVGWADTANGLLLTRAAARNFDALVTVDRGTEHQQNVNELPISIMIMPAPRNRLAELRPLANVLSTSLENRIDHLA